MGTSYAGRWSGTVGTNIPTEATNVRFSIENPRALLYTNNVENTKSDWYLGAWTGARTDRKDDFWGNPNESSTYLNPSDGHKSIYDPCPKGYRVVSPRVLDEIEQKGEFVKQSATAVFKYCYDGTNYAYWPLAGCKWGSNGGNNGNNTGLDAVRVPLAIGLTHRQAVMEMTRIRELLLCIIKFPIRRGLTLPVVLMHSLYGV